MTKNRLLRSIAQIASVEYQKRRVVGADKKEYVLLDELIETSVCAAKHRATNPQLSQSLSPAERQAFILFHDRVAVLANQIQWNDSTVSVSDIVERDPRMREIRQAAQDCLKTLGITFTPEDLLND